MELKVEEKLAREKLTGLIESGNQLLLNINKQYHEARIQNRSIISDYSTKWLLSLTGWQLECSTAFSEIFPSEVEYIKFQNVQPSSVYRAGTNTKYGTIVNTIRAKINCLIEILEGVNDYSSKRSFEEKLFVILRELKEQSDTEETLKEKANAIIQLQPNFFGLGINLNEIIKRVLNEK